MPAWTTKLDALAVAQLVRDAGEEVVPGIGSQITEEKLARLSTTSGLVGIANEDYEDQDPGFSFDEAVVSAEKSLKTNKVSGVRLFRVARVHFAESMLLPASTAE